MAFALDVLNVVIQVVGALSVALVLLLIFNHVRDALTTCKNRKLFQSTEPKEEIMSEFQTGDIATLDPRALTDSRTGWLQGTTLSDLGNMRVVVTQGLKRGLVQVRPAGAPLHSWLIVASDFLTKVAEPKTETFQAGDTVRVSPEAYPECKATYLQKFRGELGVVVLREASPQSDHYVVRRLNTVDEYVFDSDFLTRIEPKTETFQVGDTVRVSPEAQAKQSQFASSNLLELRGGVHKIMAGPNRTGNYQVENARGVSYWFSPEYLTKVNPETFQVGDAVHVSLDATSDDGIVSSNLLGLRGGVHKITDGPDRRGRYRVENIKGLYYFFEPKYLAKVKPVSMNAAADLKEGVYELKRTAEGYGGTKLSRVVSQAILDALPAEVVNPPKSFPQDVGSVIRYPETRNVVSRTFLRTDDASKPWSSMHNTQHTEEQVRRLFGEGWEVLA